MTSGGSIANTAITLGHYVYNVTVTVAHIVDSQKYNVTLVQAGTSIGSVYIAQGLSASEGDKVTITWDLGTSLTIGASVYEVYIVPAS
jgi:hypothetical protein